METQLILQSVRACSLPKLTYSDAMRFEALLWDIFPESKHYTGNQEGDFTKKLTDAVHEVLKENHLEVLKFQVVAIYYNSNVPPRQQIVLSL